MFGALASDVRTESHAAERGRPAAGRLSLR